MKSVRTCPAAAAATLSAAIAWPVGAAAAPNVLTDILPVNSIAARVMESADTPVLLVPPGASPHAYSMRPSDARAVQEADIIFWVGEGLAPWLVEPLGTLPADAEVVALSDLEGLTLLPFRQSAEFEHDDDHGQEETAGGHDDHGHEEHAHDDHEHGDVDPHIWLDPENAIVMARAMAQILAAHDPENAALYADNADAFAGEIEALETDIRAALSTVAGRRFVVFHDAYHYYEARFDFEASGSIAFSDASAPSASRIRDVREAITAREVACVFAEPQFDDSLVQTAIEGTGATSGTLDPIGMRLEPGPDLYPGLLRSITEGLKDCLAEG
jgi:zinc transport system substrate-binding protein